MDHVTNIDSNDEFWKLLDDCSVNTSLPNLVDMNEKLSQVHQQVALCVETLNHLVHFHSIKYQQMEKQAQKQVEEQQMEQQAPRKRKRRSCTKTLLDTKQIHEYLDFVTNNNRLPFKGMNVYEDNLVTWFSEALFRYSNDAMTDDEIKDFAYIRGLNAGFNLGFHVGYRSVAVVSEISESAVKKEVAVVES